MISGYISGKNYGAIPPRRTPEERRLPPIVAASSAGGWFASKFMSAKTTLRSFGIVTALADPEREGEARSLLRERFGSESPTVSRRCWLPRHSKESI
jgi:hypothetical protein